MDKEAPRLDDDIMRAVADGGPIAHVITDLLSIKTPAMAWLDEAGEKLRRQRTGVDVEAGPRKLSGQAKRLFERDGDECWLCGDPLGDDITVEHKQPRALGGTSADENCALCHGGCNRSVGHLPLSAKEAARAQIRREKGNPV